MTTAELNDMGFTTTGEPQAEQLKHVFRLKDTSNIDKAQRILKSMRVKHNVEERGLSLEFGFYTEFDLSRAFRNIRLNINRAIEGRAWA